MRCEQSLGNLTALLQNELSQAETDEVQRHLAVCEGCRNEYRDLSVVQKSLRGDPPIEPSGGSRRELQAQIDAAVAGRRKGNSATGREETRPQWRLMTPPPQPAIGYEPPRALPLPASPKTDLAPLTPLRAIPARAKSDATSISASGRRHAISTRLSAPASERRAYSFAIWVSCAVIFLASLVIVAVLFRQPAPQPDTFRAQRLASGRRLDERSAAKVRGRLSDTLVNTQIQLGEAAGDYAVLTIVPHSDPRTGESCVVAYRDADLAAIRNDARIDRPAFDALLKQAAQQVTVDDGKCTLPRSWVEQYLSSDPKVSVLNLENRIEIWSAASFEKYLSGGGNFNPDVNAPARSGLPPVKPQP